MIVLIFDLDDTLLMSNEYNTYNDINFNSKLLNLLTINNYDKYIYTNGTYGHAESSIPKLLGNTNIFKKMYARDTIPFMKPNFKSFNYVNNDIFDRYNYCTNNICKYDNIKYVFFDDNLDNMKTAKNIGWTTVWIPHRNYKNTSNNNYNFVDYKFNNIYSALNNLNQITQDTNNDMINYYNHITNNNINNNLVNYLNKRDFLPSQKFTGYKRGFHFKKGNKGLGYYIETN